MSYQYIFCCNTGKVKMKSLNQEKNELKKVAYFKPKAVLFTYKEFHILKTPI